MGCRARCGLWRSVKNPKPLPVRSYINLHRLNLPLAALLYRHTPGLNKVCQATLHLASTLFTSVMMVQPLLASKAPSRRHVRPGFTEHLFCRRSSRVVARALHACEP